MIWGSWIIEKICMVLFYLGLCDYAGCGKNRVVNYFYQLKSSISLIFDTSCSKCL